MKIIVNSNPSENEIEEMLDCVKHSYDLKAILPPQLKDKSHAQTLMYGWTYLFYRELDFIPLGFVHFAFHKGKARPVLHIASTRFICEIELLIVSRLVIKFMLKQFRFGVAAYIVNERVEKFAAQCGFTPRKQEKNLWVLAADQT